MNNIKMREEKIKRKQQVYAKAIMSGTIALLPIMMVVGIVKMGAYARNSGMCVLFIVVAVVFIVIALCLVGQGLKLRDECNQLLRCEYENRELERQRAIKNRREEFRYECYLNRVDSPKTEYEKEKVRVIAKQYGIASDEAESVLQQAIKENNKNLREEESKEKQRIETYAHYYGTSKRIAMIKPILDSCEREINAKWELADKMQQFAMNSMEQTKDWGFRAGMANSLAGPLAGIDAINQIERENAEVRQRNQQRNNMALAALKLASDSEENKEIIHMRATCSVAMDRAKTLLVDKNMDESSVLREVKISGNATISNSGNIIVSAKAKLNNSNFRVFSGQTKGAVDGTIEVSVFVEGKKLGSANLVLPTFGLCSTEEVELKGIIEGDYLDKTSKRMELTFAPKPGYLWAMEYQAPVDIKAI